MGCCLWGHTESDTTEVTQQQQQQQQEEGNGNPLQYSCLGNPTDRGAGGLWSKRSQKNRGGRREEGSGWGTHVYLWWIHFDIWQNKYSYVKFKNKIKKKKKNQTPLSD